MFSYVYSLPLYRVILWILLAVVCWAVIGRRLRPKRIWRIGNALGLLLAVGLIIYLTVFKRSAGANGVLLRPFQSFAAAQEKPELYRSMLMNVLLFVPFGLTMPNTLPQRWNTGWRICLTVLAALILSTGIEWLQYTYQLGMAETDDVIMNTLGAAVGACHLWMMKLPVKFRRNGYDKD